MAINWTTIENEVDAEIESKKLLRSAEATALLFRGLTSYFTSIQAYVASEAAAVTSLASLCTAIAADLTSGGDLPSATELAALIPSADLALIVTQLETEYQSGVTKSVDDLINDKYPAVEA
jgi:hypothetical protein